MSTQETLTGEEADCGRYRPQTFIKCYECGEWILRSQRYDHAKAGPHPRWENQFMEPRGETLDGGDE